MTTKSVLQIIRKSIHFLLTMVGAFFVCWYILAAVIHGVNSQWNQMYSLAWPLIPCMILAAVYTWVERPKKAEGREAHR